MAMGQAELGISKPVSFPPYRRSHLRSQTYLTLFRIFSHLPATPDNGGGRMEQEKLEKGPEFSEFVGSASVDPMDAVPEKIIQENNETTEGVGEKCQESGANDVILRDIERMLGIEEVEDTLRRQPEDIPMQENYFDEQQRIMDEWELAVEGTQDLLCDSGLISMNSGLGEKQDGGSEVELMDYKVERVDFQHSDVNKSGNTNDLQVQIEFNQPASESFHPPLIINESTSTKEQASASMNMVCTTMDSLPTKDGELEKEEYCCANVSEALPISSDHMTSEALNACKDGRLLEVNKVSNSLDIQLEIGDMEEGELASNSSSILMEKGDIKGGQLPGDFGMDGEYGSVPKPKNSKESELGSKEVTHLPTNFARNQVSYGELWEEDASQDHKNSSASKHKVDVSSKKKRGPGSEERKAKRKQKKRKRRAEKNAQLGVKRLKLPPAMKSKTVSYCRHYLVGRCHEGDKCQFSHDTVPLTKSKPCCHFARHSCMKGDDCPFDHELSKYPCNNFVTNGFCSRGDACLFSHKILTKEDHPTPSKVSRPELKSPLLSRNTSFSVPPNSHGSSAQQKLVINSMGFCSLPNSEDKVSGTELKQHVPAPKGINFINTAKSSLPSCSTPKQVKITPNKESLFQTGASVDQSTSSSNQTLLDNPKKLPAVAPKGVNFLSFGKGSVCSFKSSIISSSLNTYDCSKAICGTKQSVPKTDLVSYLNFSKNQAVTEAIKSNFPRKASVDDATTVLQGSSYCHMDQSHSKSVQQEEKVSDCSQTSTATSSMLLVSQFGQQRSLKFFPFRSHEHASN